MGNPLSAPLDGRNQVLALLRGFAATFRSLKLVLIMGFVLMRGCPSKGLVDGGMLDQALMTGRTTLDTMEREDVQPGYRLPFDYSRLVLKGLK